MIIISKNNFIILKNCFVYKREKAQIRSNGTNAIIKILNLTRPLYCTSHLMLHYIRFVMYQIDSSVDNYNLESCISE